MSSLSETAMAKSDSSNDNQKLQKKQQLESAKSANKAREERLAQATYLGKSRQITGPLYNAIGTKLTIEDTDTIPKGKVKSMIANYNKKQKLANQAETVANEAKKAAKRALILLNIHQENRRLEDLKKLSTKPKPPARWSSNLAGPGPRWTKKQA